MSQESELSRRLTRAIKAGDKLVANVKRDLGNLIVAGKELKDLFDEIENKRKEQGDK